MPTPTPTLPRSAVTSATLALAIFAGAAHAQWSTDPAVNLTLSDRPGEQNQAKIRPTADGGCWVSWYDNADGGYDVFVQKLDAAGIPQLALNGVLVRDLGFSSTQDYDLKVDSQGNAVLAFRDDRTVPGTTQITAQKVSPAGELLWGPTGVTASTGTGSDRNNPKCAVLPGDFVVVGWGGGSPSAISLRVINADGTARGAAPTVFPDLAATVRPIQMSDMQAADDGVIVLGVRCSGANCVTSNKHLYAQKYAIDPHGADVITPLWDRDPNNATPSEHIIVFDGTSIQTGTFPSFVPDGAGGAAFAWYETGGSRRAYVQRLSANGAEHFAHNGTPVLITSNLSISAGMDFDAASGAFLVAVKTSNATQTQWDVRASRVNADGSRPWGDGGVVLSPLQAVQSGFERGVRDGAGGMVAVWIENSGNPSRIRAARVAADGSLAWGADPIDACSVSSTKARLDATLGSLGNTLAVWGDARADVNNIVAQSILPDGSLGPPGTGPSCPADFDGSGTVDPDDLADYIACYFSSPPCDRADFDGSGSVDPDDLSDFIAGFFLGC